MRLLNTLRLTLVLNMPIMLLQAAFAGSMLAGDGWAVYLHETTAKILVLVPLGVAIFGGALRLLFWSMREASVTRESQA